MEHMSKRQQELAELLLEEKRRLWAEVRRELFKEVGENLAAEYDFPQDTGDQGLLDALEDVGLAVADVRRQQLTRMDAALRRLKEGRYGLCEDCGVEISLARLQAAPYAERCLSCQKKREGIKSGPGNTL